MSELKADKTFVFGEECLAYKKSEADKVIAEKDEEIRRLERALWLARAEMAKHIATFCYYTLHYGRVPVREIYQCQDKWDEVERKCLKKAEEYR